jgi:hypothetical protein
MAKVAEEYELMIRRIVKKLHFTVNMNACFWNFVLLNENGVTFWFARSIMYKVWRTGFMDQLGSDFVEEINRNTEKNFWGLKSC